MLVGLGAILMLAVSFAAAVECPEGELENRNGCFDPESWVGDGSCDDGMYTCQGDRISLAGDAFDCDDGDGSLVGACCVDGEYRTGISENVCTSVFAGGFLRNGTGCDDRLCIPDCGTVEEHR